MAERPTDPRPLVLRPKEAAKALGVGPRTLWRWTRNGVIPYIRIGKVIRYPVAALQAWLEEQSHKPTPPCEGIARDTESIA